MANDTQYPDGQRIFGMEWHSKYTALRVALTNESDIKYSDLEMCTLLAFVDDATSQLMALRFVTSGIGVRLLPHDAGLSGDTRQAVRVLQRQA